MLERSTAMDLVTNLAAEVLARCDEVASFSEEPGKITRTFLSDAMRRLHGRMIQWMEEAGSERSARCRRQFDRSL